MCLPSYSLLACYIEFVILFDDVTDNWQELYDGNFFNSRWQQSLTMEVILSAAFGIQSESQTNPEDKITLCVNNAMTPKAFLSISLMIPLIGKRLAKSIALTSWGFNWNPLIKIARSIIKSRKDFQGETRVVGFISNFK